MDPSIEPLRGRRIAILGYGSQGRAQARCLADSGLDVVIGLREGSASRATVERDGLRAAGLEPACRGADLIAFLLPDREQPAVFEAAVRPVLAAGTTLLFAHGFNIRFDRIHPPSDVDVVLVGPKAPGPMLRAVFERGGGVPSLVAVDRALVDTLGVPVVRADFPYRREGRRAPDRAPKLIACVREEAALLATSAGISPTTVVLGGRSMGGRRCPHPEASAAPAHGTRAPIDGRHAPIGPVAAPAWRRNSAGVRPSQRLKAR